MCELFGMSSRFPTTVNFSLEEFASHAGFKGPHKDGWGIAYYEGKDVRCFREAHAASHSPLIRFVEEYGLVSNTVISHIRLATQGACTLPNTQPFSRELGGRRHVFAHNGDLIGLHGHADFPLGDFRPIGATDSELSFCILLDRLRPLWRDGAPLLAERTDIIDAFAADIRPLGPANFIYSDGDALFYHGHRRRQRPGGPFEPPGLHILERSCGCDQPSLVAIGLSLQAQVDEDDPRAQQSVVLAASVPLTDEPWQPLGDGELVVVRNGEIAARRQSSSAAPQD